VRRSPDRMLVSRSSLPSVATREGYGRKAEITSFFYLRQSRNHNAIPVHLRRRIFPARDNHNACGVNRIQRNDCWNGVQNRFTGGDTNVAPSQAHTSRPFHQSSWNKTGELGCLHQDLCETDFIVQYSVYCIVPCLHPRLDLACDPRLRHVTFPFWPIST